MLIGRSIFTIHIVSGFIKKNVTTKKDGATQKHISILRTTWRHITRIAVRAYLIRSIINEFLSPQHITHRIRSVQTTDASQLIIAKNMIDRWSPFFLCVVFGKTEAVLFILIPTKAIRDTFGESELFLNG